MSTTITSPSARNAKHIENTHSDGETPRASLAVRITLVALAVLSLGVAGVVSVNLIAVTQFNQATASLNSNLTNASKTATDLDTLSAAQQQTDAQFQDAGSLSFLLLPQLKQAIETNTQVSRQLSQRTQQQIAKQKALVQDSEQQADSESTASSDTKNSAGLSDEQKKQVEELLKANQQSTPSNSSEQNEEDTGSAENTQTAKPW